MTAVPALGDPPRPLGVRQARTGSGRPAGGPTVPMDGTDGTDGADGADAADPPGPRSYACPTFSTVA